LRRAIWEELRRYAGAGAAILMTTHVMDEAERCDTVVMLREGTILARGTPDELKKATGQPTLEGCFLHYGSVR
jgi:ABC-2 type transport system ATP-binding protein